MSQLNSHNRITMTKNVAMKCVSAALGALLLPTMLGANAAAAPLLRCAITYAGTTHTLDTAAGSDPYTAESIDIDGRFRFKAVVLGTDRHIETIKLYVYYETRRQPVLIQEAKYVPPFASSDSPYALTGLHYLYAPPLGRELQYGCALLEVRP
jgi:hypothetical protein